MGKALMAMAVASSLLVTDAAIAQDASSGIWAARPRHRKIVEETVPASSLPGLAPGLRVQNSDGKAIGTVSQVLTDGPTAQITAPGCGPLLINPGQTGYYRVNYTAQQLQALQGAFTKLAAVDQYGLINDQMALAVAAYQPMGAGLGQAGPAAELEEELGLGNGRPAEAQIACRVLDENPAAERVLDLLDAQARRLEADGVVRQWQQMIEVGAAADAPREMLRDERGLDPLDQSFHAEQMTLVERIGAGERQPDSVQRDRIVGSQPLERGHGGPATQIVLRVHFEERDGRPGRHDLGDVRRSQADPGASRNRSQTIVARDHGIRRPPFVETDQARLGMRLPPTTLPQAPAGI